MSLNIDSTTCSVASGIRDNRKRFRCYRSENMCVWPQLQKKFETSNKAFYISVHTSQHNMPTITNRKPSDDTSRIKVLQRYPNKSSTTRHCTIQQQDMNEKVRHLSLENFVIGNIQSDADDSKATHNPRDRFKARKHKQVPAHPEVIDIKVSSDVKSTKLNHRFLREGYGPGYVTVLSPPCNCPDITIFLPCCCDQSESCSLLKNTLSREAQQYSLIPVVGKETK
ncbi:hypothetical protein QE152_g6015 [Popillia japonica]|uniref:Uncharacterized protein n=1 Tax=Popillia japonica TaxID=7064 RepID=A0AAW1MJY9_POPJA